MSELDLQSTISKGSKSFYLASLFFTPKIRQASWVLYRWCRYCDDRIDLTPSPGEAYEELKTMSWQTREALQSLTGPKVFKDLGNLCQEFKIPSELPVELLKGFEKDVLGDKLFDLSDVEGYAYNVAGAVGVMMAYIMGVKNPSALKNAEDLGTAMQLTNIARDVAEDFERGRIYLPIEWLNAAGVAPQELLQEHNREKVFALVLRLLERAEDLYLSGLRGLKYLPFREALAVGIAARIYRAIGRKIKRKGKQALEKRTSVGLLEKLALTLGSFAHMSVAWPERVSEQVSNRRAARRLQ